LNLQDSAFIGMIEKSDHATFEKVFMILFFNGGRKQSFYNFVAEYYCPNVLDYQENSLDMKGKIV